ncbi:hypothetical protein [Marinilabilia salmonicolor]|uniref:hypothetical protein n=2 Tax=Marinilabilia salmonicolor TaxID=989 RepID=UPI00029AF20E|nr:hypothetical protein [Marinilabilia salmonicolor]
MDEEKNKIAKNFVDYVKKFDVLANGRITSTTIEQNFHYCKRQFDRIFKQYSKYTPLEIAERFRLLSCVENIHNGHTLAETALQYDFTPEGLSKAIRSKLNLDVKKIKGKKLEIDKHIKISNTMVQLDQYKHQLKKEVFMEILEALEEEKILKMITTKDPHPESMNEVELHFDFKKITKILMKFDGYRISKKDYQNLDLQESVVILAICKKESDSENYQFELRESELASYIFILGFFFNIESLNLKNDFYTFILSDELRIILDSLKEIEEVTKETFDIILTTTIKKDNVIVEFNPMFKEMMIEFKNPNQ